jgi:broad specificity phosphatase PhoE
MLKIYIARHGQDEDNAAGILNGHRNMPLTEIGVGQAEQLASKIQESGLMFDKVYSTPLLRGYITAKTVTNKLGLPKPEVMEDLIERDFGVMTGRLVSEIETLCAPDIIKTKTITYFLSPKGAETFPQLFARGVCVLEYIRRSHTDGSILLVTSGDIGKMIYAAYYNLDWRDVLTGFHFGNSELLVLSEDSSAIDSHVIRIEQHNH